MNSNEKTRQVQGATLSSHAFLELPRLPWPYVVMTCGPGETQVLPVWFFEQVMMKENIFFFQGWVWLVSGIWFEFGLGGFEFMLISIGLMALICSLIDWLLHWLQNRLVGFNIFPSSQRTWHQHIWNTKNNHKTCLQTTRCDKKPTS